MKKVKYLAAVAVVCVSMLVYGDAFAQKKKFEGTTLKVLFCAGHKQFKPIWEKFSEFEKETGMKIELVTVPVMEIQKKAMLECRYGKGEYDVMEPNEFIFPAIHDFVAPIEDFVRSEGVNFEEWSKQLIPHARNLVTFDGKLKLYPHYNICQVGLYRADLFEDPEEKAKFRDEFGYELEMPPKTMEQLLDFAKFFTRDTDGDGKIDLWGLLVPGDRASEHIFSDLWYTRGEKYEYFDKDGYCMWGPKHPENWELAIELAQFQQNLLWKWKVTPISSLGIGLSEMMDMYLEGMGAMAYSFTFFIWPDTQRPETTRKIGVTKSWNWPAQADGGPRAGGYGLAINGKSRNKEAAWEFVKWFISEDNQKLALTKGIGIFVPGTGQILQWAVSQGLLPLAYVDTMVREKPCPKPVPKDIAYQVAQLLMQEYTRELVAKGITPEEFVKRSGSEVDEVAQEAREAQ